MSPLTDGPIVRALASILGVRPGKLTQSAQAYLASLLTQAQIASRDRSKRIALAVGRGGDRPLEAGSALDGDGAIRLPRRRSTCPRAGQPARRQRSWPCSYIAMQQPPQIFRSRRSGCRDLARRGQRSAWIWPYSSWSFSSPFRSLDFEQSWTSL